MTSRKTIEDVALAAKVSIATVSRVFSKPDLVRKSTRDVVMKAAYAMDYQPDAAARALASGRTHTVGCVVPTLDHTIFARSIQAMQTTLATLGYQLLVASYEYDSKAESEVVRTLQQRGVDALILVGTDHAAHLWKSLKTWGKPTLLTWSCDDRLPSIGFDNLAAAQLGTEHLLALGHKKIGVISGYIANNDRARSRLEGVKQAMNNSGLPLNQLFITEQALTIDGGKLGLRKLLDGKQMPTAIFCGNDLLAAGALFEAQRLNLNVPKDLSICGIGNYELAQAMNPGLTTIHLPSHDLGRIAALTVLSAIAGETIASTSLLPYELIVRGSTATVASIAHR